MDIFTRVAVVALMPSTTHPQTQAELVRSPVRGQEQEHYRFWITIGSSHSLARLKCNGSDGSGIYRMIKLHFYNIIADLRLLQ